MITNTVATGSLKTELDLGNIANPDGMPHHDRNFSRLLLRRLKPYKSHCQLYKNGMMPFDRAKSVRKACKLAVKYCIILRNHGYMNAVFVDLS